jgi:hypothetical protein
MRNIIRVAALALLCLAVSLPAFQKNARLAAMGDLSSLDLGAYSCGRSLCRQTLDYSGMVYDFHRHKILLFGGGHATEMWNQVEEFDFATLTWKELNVPDSCPFYLDSTRGYPADSGTGWPAGGTVGYDGDKRPISRHTYDGLDMLPDTCLMFMSSPQCDKGGCMSQAQWTAWTYFHDPYYWLFDPVRVKWTRLTPDAVAQSFASPTAVDPLTGRLYVKQSESGTTYYYDWRTRTKTVVNTGCPISWEIERTGTYFPANRSMLYFAASNILEFSFTANTWTSRNPSGGNVDSYGKGVPFDSVNQVFGVFSNGKFNYYSPWTNTWYSPSGFSVSPTFNHTIYDPVDNVYIVLNSASGQYYGWNTWAYKFSDTPGKYTGTRAAARVNRGVLRGRAAIEVSAVPNPFKTSVRLRCSGSGEISVYTAGGKKVWRAAIAPGRPEAVWNAGSNASGLYMAVYSTAAGQRTSRPLFLAK